MKYLFMKFVVSFIFVIIFNLFPSGICYAVDIADMTPNFFFSSKTTIECLNKIHGMDKIKIERLVSQPVLLTKFHMFFPFFYGGPNGKFSNLSSFFTATNNPRIEQVASSSDDCGNYCSDASSKTNKESSRWYVRCHFGYIILLSFGISFFISTSMSWFFLIYTQRRSLAESA